jgi:hypothetical protein
MRSTSTAIASTDCCSCSMRPSGAVGTRGFFRALWINPRTVITPMAHSEATNPTVITAT